MRKPAAYLFAMLVGSIIWFFFQHFKVTGTESLRVVPQDTPGLLSVGCTPVPVWASRCVA